MLLLHASSLQEPESQPPASSQGSITVRLGAASANILLLMLVNSPVLLSSSPTLVTFVYRCLGFAASVIHISLALKAKQPNDSQGAGVETTSRREELFFDRTMTLTSAQRSSRGSVRHMGHSNIGHQRSDKGRNACTGLHKCVNR